MVLVGVVVGAGVLAMTAGVASAAITTTGNVEPADPSTWTSIIRGYIGNTSDGTLSISNGATVSDSLGLIGYDANATGTATVDGNGSTWTNSEILAVGVFGDGTLSISNGAAVSDSNGHIGYIANSTGSVTVDGNGSTWANGWLHVGRYGDGTLTISNGALVSVSGITFVARYPGSQGVINFAGGTLNTGTLYAGESQLTGTGTINTHGLIADANLVFKQVGDLIQSLAINSLPEQDIALNLDIDGQGMLGAGYDGEGLLAISNGVTVSSTHGYLGYKAGSAGTATVDGNGSTWDSNGTLYVGYYGAGTLTISNGGLVSNNFDGYIGRGADSSGAVIVDGNGSTWSRSNTIYVGYHGDGTLAISNGGSVSNSHSGRIGKEANSTSAVTVDGNGSTWTNGGLLSVGSKGAGTLTITNGGSVSTGRYASIGGYSVNSTGDVTVDGSGSTWTIDEYFYVGRYGDGTLSISNGGLVSVLGVIYVAQEPGGQGVINFDGGTLDTGTLYADDSRLTGTGTINTHGLVTDADLVLSQPSDLSQSFAINSYSGQDIAMNVDIDGQGDLGAGYAGNGTLTINNGMAVLSEDGCLGYKTGSAGTATVDGDGSTWTIGEYLYVGDKGGGTLSIVNGGSVSNDIYGYIAKDANSTGEVTVDGNGSTWANKGVNLYIGYGGYGTLAISNGGTVSSLHGRIGSEPNSTGTVTVDGNGSTWTNSSYLSVGNRGAGTLTISNDALVSVAGTLTVDDDNDGDGFVNMATGGMLALMGDANDSLASFLGLVHGSGAIRYWNDSISDWADITGATYGEDYTLEYITEGDLAGYTVLTVGTAPITLSVDIDVRPGSDVNPINLKSGGVIPVAILTTDTFDATTIDPDTIELSGAAVAVRGNGKHVMAEQTDVDSDGDIDLLVHIETQALVIEPGTTIVTLTGETFDGMQIEGSDDIKLVGDLNGDGTVDLVDLNIILIQWGKKGAAITDLRADTNLNGDVGLEDLNAVLIDWGKTSVQP